jgi:hypothetical protein
LKGITTGNGKTLKTMKPNKVSEISLRWYNDTTLLTENPAKLTKLFLNSIGITSGIASDIFEVLVKYNAKGVAPTTKEIEKEIVEKNKDKEGGEGDEKSLRIIQIWLKYFREIKLIDKIGSKKKGRYVFSGNKKPSEAFMLYTKPLIIDESVKYSEKILKKMEEKYENQQSLRRQKV